MPGANITVTSKQGLWGGFKARLYGIGRIHVELNLAALSQPTSGENYLSQGIHVSGELLGREVGLGLERRSPIADGKPQWQNLEPLLGYRSVTASGSGLALSASAGLFIGTEAEIENVDSLFPSRDTPCEPK
jgi:hypothetical protein